MSIIELQSTVTFTGPQDLTIDGNQATLDGTEAGVTASLSHSTSSNNSGAGVRADQQTPGTGTLSLTNVTLENNAGGATTGSNVVVSS